MRDATGTGGHFLTHFLYFLFALFSLKAASFNIRLSFKVKAK
jgi:hypothetical protein